MLSATRVVEIRLYRVSGWKLTICSVRYTIVTTAYYVSNAFRKLTFFFSLWCRSCLENLRHKTVQVIYTAEKISVMEILRIIIIILNWCHI